MKPPRKGQEGATRVETTGSERAGRMRMRTSLKRPRLRHKLARQTYLCFYNRDMHRRGGSTQTHTHADGDSGKCLRGAWHQRGWHWNSRDRGLRWGFFRWAPFSFSCSILSHSWLNSTCVCLCLCPTRAVHRASKWVSERASLQITKDGCSFFVISLTLAPSLYFLHHLVSLLSHCLN